MYSIEWYRQHDQPETVPNVDEYVEANRNQVDLPNVTSASYEITNTGSSDVIMETDEHEHEVREPVKAFFSLQRKRLGTESQSKPELHLAGNIKTEELG